MPVDRCTRRCALSAVTRPDGCVPPRSGITTRPLPCAASRSPRSSSASPQARRPCPRASRHLAHLRLLSAAARGRARPPRGRAAAGRRPARVADRDARDVERAATEGPSVVARRHRSLGGEPRDRGPRWRWSMTSFPLPEISIVLPVYNEAESLPILWEELMPVLKSVGRGAEVIVVDDGSTDGSTEFVRMLQATDPRVRLIRFAHNAGLPAAFAAGLRAGPGR